MSRLRTFAISRSPEIYALGAVLLIGLLVRLAVAPYGGYAPDSDAMGSWALRLTEVPPWQFYDHADLSDHLPGDLWILLGLAHVYQLFSPDMNVSSDTFLWLLKLVPALADVGAAIMLYLLCRQLASGALGVVAAAMYLLNPAPIFLTSFWGQWDSVSTFLALTALWLLITGRVMFALPVLTYGCLIKPQLAALMPLLALAWCLQWWKPYAAIAARRVASRRRRVLEAAVGMALSIGVMAAVLLPFNVGVGAISDHSLMERLRLAVDRWEFMTFYAFNLWAVVEPPVNYAPKPDEVDWLSGLTYRTWGILFTGVAYAGILTLYARRPDPVQLLWAAMAIMLVLFIFPTRIHERYLLPALTLMTLFAVLTPTFRILYAGFSVTFLINLWFAYHLRTPTELVDAAARSEFFYVYLSLMNVTMAIAVLLAGAIFRDRTLGAARGVRPRSGDPGLSPLPPPESATGSR